MKARRLLLAGVVVLGACAQAVPPETQPVPTRVQAADTGVYARTPLALRPYSRFENAYRTFFLTELEYPGYGRNIPEPDSLATVKIGLVGPIIGTISRSLGSGETLPLRVNERQTRWDGYNASYLAPMGTKMLQGARLAVAQINAQGGYRGKIPYELVVRNDNGNWRSAGEQVIKLAYQDSVWAIVGTVDGANTHIAIRVALKAEIPVVNTADTDPTLVETNIPWVFRNITDDREMGYLLANFVFGTLGLERVAALRAVNRYGRVSFGEFRDAATRLGHPLMAELSYEEGDTLFTPQLQQIRSLNPQAVITYGNSRESALILKQMRDMGMDQWFLGSDRMVTQELMEVVGPNHGKVAAGYPYDPTSQDPRYAEFVQDFGEAYGEAPETYAAHAYDGMMMLMQAIERAGLNRARIRDELAAVKTYHGVTGLQEYDAVFSDRSPATLALLESGQWEFYTAEEVLSGGPPGVLDSQVEFGGWQGETVSPSGLSEIRIGLFAPDSGDAARGANLAVEGINADGGFHGTPLRIVQRWAQDPWSGGAKEMIQLAYRDSVWAVLGSVDGAATHVAEQVATKAWLPLVAPVSADPTLTYIRIPWIFRLPPDDEAQAAVLVREGILSHSLAEVGVITSADHDGRTFATTILKRLGEEGVSPVFHFQVSQTDDLSGLADRVRSFEPGAVILRGPPAQLLDLVNQLSVGGVTVPLLVPWIPGFQPTDLTSLFPGTVLAIQPFRKVDNPAYATFEGAYRERYGVEPSPVAAYSYDAVNLVAQALNASGLNRAALREAISRSTGFIGAAGTVLWDNGGGNRAEPTLLFLPAPGAVVVHGRGPR